MPLSLFSQFAKLGPLTASLDQAFSERVSRRGILPYFGMVIFSILLASYLVGPLLKADFWVLDNFIIIDYLADGGIPIQDLLVTWWQDEISKAGHSWINRPLYWLLRLMEISFFDSRAWLYYLDRLICLSILIFGITWVSTSALGLSFGFLLTLRAMQLHFWNDIWTWLGPSEAFCSVGFSGIIVGFGVAVKHFTAKNENNSVGLDLPIILVATGTIIVAGCKENFVFCALPLALLTALGCCKSKKPKILSLLMSVLGLLLCLLICWLVISYLSYNNEPTEVYGRSINLLSSTVSLVHFFTLRNHLRLSVAIFAAIILLVYNAWIFRQSKRKEKSFSLAIVLLLSVALAWSFWEILFYGEFPIDHRYRFPIALIQILVIAVAGINLAKILPQITTQQQRAILRASALSLGLLFIVYQGFPLRTSAISFARDTNYFMGDLDALVTSVQKHPDFPIYVESGATDEPYEQPVAYYEPVASLNVWLRWKGVKNSVFLRVVDNPDLTGLSDFDRSLLTEIQHWAEQGEKGYQPIVHLDPERELKGSCYSLSYLAPASPQCEKLVLRWRYQSS